MVESTARSSQQSKQIEALVAKMDAMQIQVRRQQVFINAVITANTPNNSRPTSTCHSTQIRQVAAATGARDDLQKFVWHLYTKETDVRRAVAVFVQVTAKAIDRLKWEEQQVAYAVVEADEGNPWYALRAEFISNRRHIAFKKAAKEALTA